MSREIISAKIDVVFKEMFVRNRELLNYFISDMLDIPYENILEIILTNAEMPSDYSDGKLVRLDLNVRLKKEYTEELINVEMQVNSQSYFSQRTLFYWAKLYTSELKSGETYDKLKKTICINILDFNITDKKDYHTELIIADKDTKEQFCDYLSIHFFELRKIAEKIDTGDRKSLWMHLIKANTEEELNMINNTKIPAMEKAVQVIFDMSADTVLRERARIREKALHDEASNMKEAREKGRKEGLKEGRKEGRKEGLKEGEAIGLKKGQEIIIEKMRERGMTEEQIKMILE